MNLRRDRTVSEIISRLKAAKPGEGAVEVAGTWGSFAHPHPPKSVSRSSASQQKMS